MTDCDCSKWCVGKCYLGKISQQTKCVLGIVIGSISLLLVVFAQKQNREKIFKMFDQQRNPKTF